MAVVSVLMPMRNAERFVAASVRSVLAQDAADLELVVVDDGSTDRSRAVVEGIGDPRVRVIDGPRLGIAAAFNAALEAARGDVIARCDSDDLYPPGRLRWQVDWLAARPEFGAVTGSFHTIDPKGRTIADMGTGAVACEITDELRNGVTRTHFCTAAVRAELLRRVGGCRAYFTTAEDVDLQLRLGEAARVGYEPRLSLLYRIHNTSITHVQPDDRRLFFDAVARTFQQQRRETGRDDLDRGSPPDPPAPAAAKPPMGAAEHLQHLLQGRAWQEHRQGRRGRAVVTGFRACLARPWNAGVWKSLAALAVRPIPKTGAVGATVAGADRPA